MRVFVTKLDEGETVFTVIPARRKGLAPIYLKGLTGPNWKEEVGKVIAIVDEAPRRL